MIEIQELSKSFGKLHVLRELNLNLDHSGITAVLGPNASGKTTLIKSILGMVIPDSGTIRIDGEDVGGQFRYRDKVSYLPQIARFPENLRVSEMLSMISSLRSRESRTAELLRHFELESTLNQKLAHLSGGTRQKINLVVALMYDNPLIILDEPSAGLDPVALVKAKEFIREEQRRGKMILITTHIMGLVEELADKILFLLDGKVHFDGSIKELLERYRSDSIETSIAQLLRENNA